MIKRGRGPTVIRCVLIVLFAAATWQARGAGLPTKAQGLLMMAGAIAAADLGFKVTRHLTPFSLLKRHSAAQVAIFAVIGTIYAVIAAFIVVVVWENYSKTDEIVSTEANGIADLERMSRGFDVVVRRQVQEAARTYTREVIEDEWSKMGRGESSPLAQAALAELWTVYTDMAKERRDPTMYEQSITRLNEIDDNRRLRLAASNATVPQMMWFMLYFGGMITIALAYFFESPADWFHRFMISSVAGIIMFSIFLVAALDTPFEGDLHITPQAFQFAIDNMQNLEQ